jgi:hypothetical protein
MLCPECERPAAGGTPCPHCGEQVPERESFGGQGTHYLVVLALASVLLVAITVLNASRNVPLGTWLRALYTTGWLWVYIPTMFFPAALGVYYWFILRDEEIAITDQGIWRHSHWGEESLAWRDVHAFNRRPILFRQTRLGRIAALSRVLVQRKLFFKIPAARYELVGVANGQEPAPEMYLEPGTVDDMAWMLRLIEEHLGPATTL